MHHSFCIIVCYRAVRSAILATAGLLVISVPVFVNFVSDFLDLPTSQFLPRDAHSAKRGTAICLSVTLMYRAYMLS